MTSEKNLVKIMMETAGFDMIDLGRDVELQKFVDVAKEEKVDLVCMFTLMTTTMGGMETVIQLLEEAGIRDQVKVMIGGRPDFPEILQIKSVQMLIQRMQ